MAEAIKTEEMESEEIEPTEETTSSAEEDVGSGVVKTESKKKTSPKKKEKAVASGNSSRQSKLRAAAAAAAAASKSMTKKSTAKGEGEVKKKKSPVTHPRTLDMVVEAIQDLKEAKGSSVQAIRAWILAKYRTVRPDMIKVMMRRGLAQGLDEGVLMRPKKQVETQVMNGRYLIKKAAKAAAVAVESPRKKAVPAAKATPIKKRAVKRERQPPAKVEKPAKKSRSKAATGAKKEWGWAERKPKGAKTARTSKKRGSTAAVASSPVTSPSLLPPAPTPRSHKKASKKAEKGKKKSKSKAKKASKKKGSKK